MANLSVKNLVKAYRGKKVVNAVSLSVDSGEVTEEDERVWPGSHLVRYD